MLSKEFQEKELIEEQIRDLRRRMNDVEFGEVGIVFSMNFGKVNLIKPIHQPTIKVRLQDDKG